MMLVQGLVINNKYLHNSSLTYFLGVMPCSDLDILHVNYQGFLRFAVPVVKLFLRSKFMCVCILRAFFGSNKIGTIYVTRVMKKS